MQRLVLVRKESTDEGTFGELVVGPMKFYTGELPWRDVDKDGYSDADYSCIAPGVYPARVTRSNRFQRDLYELFNVEKRFSIRIHPANWMGDSKKGFKCELNGCIALGKSITTLDGQKAISGSKKAVEEFMAALANQPFEIEIRNA